MICVVMELVLKKIMKEKKEESQLNYLNGLNGILKNMIENKLSKEQIDEIMNWCYKNNTIEFYGSKLRLAVLDGGWVNVIKLKKFLENEK